MTARNLSLAIDRAAHIQYLLDFESDYSSRATLTKLRAEQRRLMRYIAKAEAAMKRSAKH